MSNPLVQYHCDECDEDREFSSTIFSCISSQFPICSSCGSTLLLIRPTNTIENNDNNSFESFLDKISEFLGEELREAIDNSMRESVPTRQINSSYLTSLGKVIIDSRKSILYDIVVTVGPLKTMGISAGFGYLPLEPLEIKGNVILGDPIHGETTLNATRNYANAALFLDRGVVSFASKTKRAMESQSQALIVAQTLDMWPFVMSDSANELQGSGEYAVTIPVVMVSKKDAELIKGIISSTGVGRGSMECPISIGFGHVATECSICQELFQVDEEVIKLTCRHVYHTLCVMSWLNQHSTCPLCRKELPSQTISVPKSNANSSDRNGISQTSAQPYFY